MDSKQILGTIHKGTYADRWREGVKTKAYAPYNINLFPYSKSIHGEGGGSKPSQFVYFPNYVLSGWSLV